MSIKQAIEALEVAQDALDISQSLQESAKSNHHPKTLAAYERVSAALAALRSMPAEPDVVTIPAFDGFGTTPPPAPVLLSDAWISVDERLPGEQGCDSEEVMLFINGHCEITDMECRQGGAWGLRLGYFDAEKQAFRVHGRPESFVTHWQPLPPPPIEQAGRASRGAK